MASYFNIISIVDNFTSKLRSLRTPDKKMSKSDPDPKSRICLTDTPDEITMKIKKAVTDFTSQVNFTANAHKIIFLWCFV